MAKIAKVIFNPKNLKSLITFEAKDNTRYAFPHFLFGDNVYEILEQYFKYCIVGLWAQQAHYQVTKSVSIVNMLQSHQLCLALRH